MDNICDSYAPAGNYMVHAFGPPGVADLYPVNGALTGIVISTSSFAAVQEFNYDFNDTRRNHTYRGAYSGGGAIPGWSLALTNKPFASGAIFNISFGTEGFRAEIPTRAGRAHSFEYVNDVVAPTWISVTNINGNGTEFDVVDPTGSAPSRIYRTRTTLLSFSQSL